jgi:hypothetical protein
LRICVSYMHQLVELSANPILASQVSVIDRAATAPTTLVLVLRVTPPRVVAEVPVSAVVSKTEELCDCVLAVARCANRES